MKISEIAHRADLPISTVRHYVNTGLLVPKVVNTKFVFSEHDFEEILFIIKLRDMGFQLSEIHQVVSLRRISNWVELDDLRDYYNILQVKKLAQKSTLQEIRKQITVIDIELKEVNNRILSIKIPHTQTGIPVSALSFLECPFCKKPLQLTNAQMDYKYISNCMLTCSCGYQASVRNGILYTQGPEISQYDKPDIQRAVYKTMPNDLVTLFQKTYNWMLQWLNNSSSSPKVIMETHLNSFFFLYKHFFAFHKNSTYILIDKYAEIIEMYKKYIDKLGLELDILYIVNNDATPPLSEGIVDLFIDYNSSNEHAIYSHTSLLPIYRKYMKSDCRVIGTYWYFDTNSQSLRTLQQRYLENHPDNYKQFYFLKTIRDTFDIVVMERLGVCTDSGDDTTFSFHQNGENLYVDCFLLTLKDSPHKESPNPSLNMVKYSHE